MNTVTSTMTATVTAAVTSRDGTTIAYDRFGEGPTIILVGGAFQHRAIDPGTDQIAKLLASHFTVFHYDRRGRGDSSDTLPYAVAREIEDIEALIDAGDGPACLFGNSSGAALALEATLELGDKVQKLAMYEAPYALEGSNQQEWKAYTRKLHTALAASRRDEAVAAFMELVGLPADQIDAMRQTPMWAGLAAVAPTLAYDAAVLGEDAHLPVERARRVVVPTLVMDGSESYPFMHVAAQALAEAIPTAQYRTLEGQTHDVEPHVLAAVLAEFCGTGGKDG
jgi:pimeloyl-ACP methyl ester carboxylesterase